MVIPNRYLTPPREALAALNPEAIKAAVLPVDSAAAIARIDLLDHVDLNGGKSELGTLLASLLVVAVDNAYRHRKYRCSGCGNTSDHPGADLAIMQARGKYSCCPERKMIPKMPGASI